MKVSLLKVNAISIASLNLHNLPILPNTVLGALNEDDLNDLDINESRLNIGMTFTTENWTCEDHFTNLVNYQFLELLKSGISSPNWNLKNLKN